jgi:cardiolipin synthase
VPDPQLRDSLKDAARRGVDVRLILPSHSDSSLVLYASRSFYSELLEAGVRIFERQDALLHSKTASSTASGPPSARPIWTGAASSTTRKSMP